MAKAKEQRVCQCGQPAEKHEEKSTQTSSWRGKCIVEGSTCKRYKWAKQQNETVKVAESEVPAEVQTA